MAPVPPSPGSSRLFSIMFGGFFAVFAVVLITFMAIYLWPKGEPVGAIDLRVPASLVAVDAAAGDTLHFRLDVTAGTGAYAGSTRAKTSTLYEVLRACTITISDAGPGGARSASCAAYDGKSTGSSGSSDTLTLSGVPIACTFKALAPGAHVVTAKVTWASNADIRAANLEVRREAGKK